MKCQFFNGFSAEISYSIFEFSNATSIYLPGANARKVFAKLILRLWILLLTRMNILK